jgi:hypothetical protein
MANKQMTSSVSISIAQSLSGRPFLLLPNRFAQLLSPSTCRGTGGARSAGAWPPICMPWGAQDKVVQRLLRHSKPHVTRERYIRVFDRTLLDAVENVQRRIEELKRAQADRQQLELKFGDDFAVAKRSTDGGFPQVSALRPAAGKQDVLDPVVNC